MLGERLQSINDLLADYNSIISFIIKKQVKSGFLAQKSVSLKCFKISAKNKTGNDTQSGNPAKAPSLTWICLVGDVLLSTIARSWFQTCFVFSHTCGNDPILTDIFQVG